MRENRPYGLEGGETGINRSSLPLCRRFAFQAPPTLTNRMRQLPGMRLGRVKHI